MIRSYMASMKTAAQESAIHANQIHHEASKQMSAYQQQIFFSRAFFRSVSVAIKGGPGH